MPVFYAAVGSVALVPATVVAALTRMRWWMAIAGVPVGAMVGTFLWSLATAAGRGRRRRTRRCASSWSAPSRRSRPTSTTAARLLTHEDTDVGIATFTHEDRRVTLIAEGIDLGRLTLVRLADPHRLVDEFERRRRRSFTPSNR